MIDDLDPSRRHLLGIGLVGAALVSSTDAALAAPSAADTGRVEGGRVQFPDWTAPTERPPAGPPGPTPPTDRVGFAVVGLGRLALEQIIPGFGRAKRARLVALVSGTPDKAEAVAAQYGVRPEAVYGYDDFDRVRDNPEIEVVYIVLPNAMHRAFTERAAAAGKHVLCEKPMATNVADCEAMIDACKRAGRKLMIAYRCQYEPFNRDVLRMVRDRTYGPVRFIDAANLQNMGRTDQWRFKRSEAGGGALPDVGLYCLNAARFLTGEEPVEVFGRAVSPPGDPRYETVEETIQFALRFPSGVVANCAASYGMHEARSLRVHTPGAAIDFVNAYAYAGHELSVSHRDGRAESVDRRKLEEKDQFALEMDHMAECVRANRTPHTPGEEGLQDQRLMEAIYRSAATGRPVALAAIPGLDTTRGPAPTQD